MVLVGRLVASLIDLFRQATAAVNPKSFSHSLTRSFLELIQASFATYALKEYPSQSGAVIAGQSCLLSRQGFEFEGIP